MTVTSESDCHLLIQFAKTLKGQPLETSAQRKQFSVEVVGNGLIFILASGNVRPSNKPYTERVLERFNATQSLKPGDYQDLSVNASNLLRLLEMMTSERTRSPRSKHS